MLSVLFVSNEGSYVFIHMVSSYRASRTVWRDVWITFRLTLNAKNDWGSRKWQIFCYLYPFYIILYHFYLYPFIYEDVFWMTFEMSSRRATFLVFLVRSRDNEKKKNKSKNIHLLFAFSICDFDTDFANTAVWLFKHRSHILCSY